MARCSCLLAAAITLSCGGTLFADGYRFLIPVVDATAGDPVRLSIKGEHEASAQGFSLAARYPAGDMTIERVHYDDTILEAMSVDFFEVKLSPANGMLAVGVLMDSKPPFEGQLIPSIPPPLGPLNFIHLEIRVGAAAEGMLAIRLENGLFTPPIDNLYSVNNRAVYVTELTEGGIRLPGGQGQGSGGEFLRGDLNMDSILDISDPIGVLEYVFRGSSSPPCLQAADANDDERVDLSDPIFVLSFLFRNGPALPPPSAAKGPDPTPGGLGCDHGL